MNYYNEWDKEAAHWLRCLIKEQLIPSGIVDETSIVDIDSDSLKRYTQCHFFAGIGGWSEALRLAGWPSDIPVWTGSCPCQPFSSSGKQRGIQDERHLWPHFFRHIKVCKPHHVFGEQVEKAIKFGWLDEVATNLETEGYACGTCILGASSVGAQHLRKRLYWVASNTSSARLHRCVTLSEIMPKANAETCRMLNMSKDDVKGYVLKRNFEGVQPSDGISFKLARSIIKGYGNAIVPQVGAEFIKAYMQTKGD